MRIVFELFSFHSPICYDLILNLYTLMMKIHSCTVNYFSHDTFQNTTSQEKDANIIRLLRLYIWMKKRMNFSHIFYLYGYNLKLTNGMKHSTDIKNDKPIFTESYITILTSIGSQYSDTWDRWEGYYSTI